MGGEQPLVLLLHGAGDSGWYWHLVEAHLRRSGLPTAAPDLPAGRTSMAAQADAAVEAARGAHEVVVVGQSAGAFAAVLAAGRLPTTLLVLVAGMVPRPGESVRDWWAATGWSAAVRRQAEADGGLTGHEDPYVTFFHDVPRHLAEEAMRRERTGVLVDEDAPWPLPAWPDVPTRFLLCTEDRFFPADFLRAVVADRLGVVPDEIGSGHCPALSRPADLAAYLRGLLPPRAPGGGRAGAD
jgi:pimeloyl-ACP methyl ester carboxylesterase